MAWIGNDIVDLKTPWAANKSRDARFMNRVFLPEEVKRILDSANPDAMLWALWAGKEAAYKAVSKHWPGASSSPLKYAVDWKPGVGRLEGKVHAPHGEVHVKAWMHCDYVHCLGALGGTAALDNVVVSMGRIPRCSLSGLAVDESDYVRLLVRKALAGHWGLALESVRIVRQKGRSGLGPPQAWCGAQRIPADLSLSHDGDFASTAFMDLACGCG